MPTNELDATELKNLWSRTLGELPSQAQFEIWFAQHKPETVKHGILKTATKNLQMNGLMTQDHRVRFASKVMLTRTYDPQKFAGTAYKDRLEGQ